MSNARIILTTVRGAQLSDLVLSIAHHLSADLTPVVPEAYAEAVARHVAEQVKFAVLDVLRQRK